MTVLYSPFGNSQYFDTNGDPAVGYTVTTYAAGSSTLLGTFTDSSGGSSNENPVTLNTLGLNPDGQFWLSSGLSYKFVVKDADGVVVQTVDDISGVNDPATFSTTDQWVAYSGTPTYISATSFSVSGDQTSTMQVKRRLKSSNTAGTTYSDITASSFGSGITTVTVSNTSGTLDSGLSQVYYGLLSAANGSVPVQAGQLLGVQVFTSSGTYTPTVGTGSVIVEVQAGGGGSGGCIAVTSGQWAAAAPGAGGGYGRKRITSGFSGVAVTVGAGGTAGAAGNNAGGQGGSSSFGSAVTCSGGVAGNGSGSAQTAIGVSGGATTGFPAGGSVSGADVAVPGASPASYPMGLSTSIVIQASGGRAHLGPGGGGSVVLTNNVAGATPTGYGGGASGPAQCNSTFGNAAGKAGAPGIVIVYEYA